MTVAISDLRYSAPDNSMITMTVDGWLAAPIPFTYRADDQAPLTQVVAVLLAAGGYTIAAYTPPA